MLYDYEFSLRLAASDAPFDALIMAAMRRADTENERKLRANWPDLWHELDARYHAPGGRLPEDPPDPTAASGAPVDLAKYAHIPTDQIRRDIEDTFTEIATLRAMRGAEYTLARHHLDPNQRRMFDFKAGARDRQIREREAFIARLNGILAARAAAEPDTAPEGAGDPS